MSLPRVVAGVAAAILLLAGRPAGAGTCDATDPGPRPTPVYSPSQPGFSTLNVYLSADAGGSGYYVQAANWSRTYFVDAGADADGLHLTTRMHSGTTDDRLWDAEVHLTSSPHGCAGGPAGISVGYP